jgi:hypothetical protein
MQDGEERVLVDAKTFQEPLVFLVETMVQKVHREGTACRIHTRSGDAGGVVADFRQIHKRPATRRVLRPSDISETLCAYGVAPTLRVVPRAYEAFAGFLGDLPVGAYFMKDFLPHDIRPNVDGRFDIFLSTHLGRAATVLLCIVTEIQAYCRFEGGNINDRM